MKFSINAVSLGGAIALLSALPRASSQTVPDNKNVSLVIGNRTTCNATCQALVQDGLAFEVVSHAHTPLDDFYSIPPTFNTSLAPGTLLKVEVHTSLVNYTVPSGLSMSRIMYTSRSLNGTIVPVSGFVLWPYRPFPYTVKCGVASSSSIKTTGPAKFPVVAWAHGTAGQNADCAPSNYRSLQYNFMTSYPLALEGFAVVATDYAGLGAHGSDHMWLAGPAAADDVAFAVEAARAAFPGNLERDGPFVAMGHSQGGNTIWNFAERQAETPVAGYCGTITISPPSRPIDWAAAALEALAASVAAAAQPPLWASVVYSLQTKFIAAITAAYPAYNASGMTDLAYDRWYNVVKPLGACLSTENLVFADVLTNPGRTNWTQDKTVVEWQDRTAAAGKPFAGPMLVIAGDNDYIPEFLIDKDVNSTCAAAANANTSLEVSYYAATEHFSVVQASRAQWMGWLRDKFTSAAASRPEGVCGKYSPVAGFNLNYTYHTTSPNWLVTWVDSFGPEAYKFTL